MSKGEKSFEQAQAEVDRELEAARRELIECFRSIKDERGGFTRYEAACLLVPTLPRLDELGRQVQRFEDSYQEVERLEARIEAAHSKAGQNRLRPINPTDPSDQWRYKPAALVAWAMFTGTGSLDIARQVVTAEEVATTKDRRSTRHGQADRHSSNREQILGAAVAVLVARPDACKDRRGKITGQSIAEAIEERGLYLFGDDGPPLTVKTMAGHINEWVSKLRH